MLLTWEWGDGVSQTYLMSLIKLTFISPETTRYSNHVPPPSLLSVPLFSFGGDDNMMLFIGAGGWKEKVPISSKPSALAPLHSISQQYQYMFCQPTTQTWQWSVRLIQWQQASFSPSTSRWAREWSTNTIFTAHSLLVLGVLEYDLCNNWHHTAHITSKNQ